MAVTSLAPLKAQLNNICKNQSTFLERILKYDKKENELNILDIQRALKAL